MKLKSFLFFFLIIFLNQASAQKDSLGLQKTSNLILQYKDTLNSLAHAMQRGENDSIRKISANIFENILEKIVADSTSFETAFDSIKNISAKTAPDNSFRMYTWQFPDYDGNQYHYFGFLQYKNPKTHKINLFPLRDSSSVLQKPASKKLRPDNWYGSIYYSIIENKKGGKKYYTLLGWHGKDQKSTQKIMDVLSFENGKPVFGLPVFKTENIYRYRVIFEFTAQATMVLRYEANKNLIVFDHLSAGRAISLNNGIIGPDGSYDAYKFTKGHWELVEDIDVDQGFVPKKKDVKIYKDEELRKINK